MKVRLVKERDGGLTVMAESTKPGRKPIIHSSGKTRTEQKACIEQTIAEAYAVVEPQAAPLVH